MGRVFLAYDPQIDRRVAIKSIQIFAALPEADRLSARANDSCARRDPPENFCTPGS